MAVPFFWRGDEVEGNITWQVLFLFTEFFLVEIWEFARCCQQLGRFFSRILVMGKGVKKLWRLFRLRSLRNSPNT